MENITTPEAPTIDGLAMLKKQARSLRIHHSEKSSSAVSAMQYHAGEKTLFVTFASGSYAYPNVHPALADEFEDEAQKGDAGSIGKLLNKTILRDKVKHPHTKLS